MPAPREAAAERAQRVSTTGPGRAGRAGRRRGRMQGRASRRSLPSDATTLAITPRTSLCTASRSASLRLRPRAALLHHTRNPTASRQACARPAGPRRCACGRARPGRADLHPTRNLSASWHSLPESCTTELAHARLHQTQTHADMLTRMHRNLAPPQVLPRLPTSGSAHCAPGRAALSLCVGALARRPRGQAPPAAQPTASCFLRGPGSLTPVPACGAPAAALGAHRPAAAASLASCTLLLCSLARAPAAGPHSRSCRRGGAPAGCQRPGRGAPAATAVRDGGPPDRVGQRLRAGNPGAAPGVRASPMT
jgi:hypothetical protein